jgi:hypothetical protein
MLNPCSIAIETLWCKIMDKSYFNKILFYFKGYARLNWGAPFIVFFVLFLMLTGVCSLIGFLSFADSLAIYAYYLLIVGVTLQVFCLVKYRKRPIDSRDVI